MSYNNVLIEINDKIGKVIINRSDKMNALTIETIQEIGAAVNECITQNVAGIIITGMGEKAFAAGADIAEFADFNSSQAKEMSRKGHEVFNFIENSTTPVIAAVNGFALGGGCELAMACHFRIASENAKMGLPELSLGVIPGYGGTQRLPKLIGKGKAIQYTLTGDMLAAQEALTVGLVNEVVPQEELIGRCEAIINKISKKGLLAVQKALRCIQTFDVPRKDGFKQEIEAFGNSFETADFKEGTRAFMEKRSADFKGR